MLCMMDSDSGSCFEESLEAEEEVAGPLHINVNIEEPLESPPPSSPSLDPPPPNLEGKLSRGWELPDDRTNFLNFVTRADVLELKYWAQETRTPLSDKGYVVEAPVVPQSFWAFIQHFHGPQSEVQFLQLAAEALFDHMLTYVVGYSRLTSLNKSLLRRLVESWSFGEKAEKMRLFAESGRFLEKVSDVRLCLSSGPFSFWRPFCHFVPSSDV